MAFTLALICSVAFGFQRTYAADPYNEFVADSLVDGGLESKTIGEITLTQSAVCRGIEDHAPVGEASTFTSEVGKVWVYTQFKMDKEVSSTIKHVYYRNGQQISEVSLKVKGPSFRTNSCKTITPKMTGNWKVEIQSGDGQIFETLTFTIPK